MKINISFKDISIFCYDGRLTIGGNLEEGIMGNMCVKIVLIWVSNSKEHDV